MRPTGIWALVAAVALTTLVVGCGGGSGDKPKRAATGPATFEEVQEIMSLRCFACHSEKPTNELFKDSPAAGVRFDQPENIKLLRESIYRRVVVLKNMPLQNATGMTPAERERIASWYRNG